ncbi:MAG: hypothetical protein JWM99_73, partial [Verrucomicrobiales bacterium]|nr:hypothetical protein [Verrucomicrobiales bacterium]
MDRLLGAHGIPQDSAAGRTEFLLRMETRRAEEVGKSGSSGKLGLFAGM